MNGKSKNNLNFSKEMSLNIKTSTKTRDTFFKTNNASLDFASSPIKNNKKVIKRNKGQIRIIHFYINKPKIY